MKYTAIIAFFGLAASVQSAKLMLSSEEGVKADAIGSVVSAAAADSSSGVAGGSVDGDGTVIAAATVGAALGMAMSSPYF